MVFFYLLRSPLYTTMNDTAYLTLKQGDTVYNDKKFTKKDISRIRNKMLIVMLATTLVVGLAFYYLFTISYTVSGSMVPTLSVGEINVMRHVFGPGDLHRGDIVLFNPVTEYNADIADFLGNGKDHYIKRLIGLPGETIRIQDDIVYINGEPLNEPYAVYPKERTELSEDRNMEEITIPEGHYFFMGDNRDNSYDSRYGVGVIPYNNIDRKMVFHFTSLSALILGTDNDQYFIG